MIEQAMLRERVAALRDLQNQALDAYAQLASCSADPAMREQFEQFSRDEDRQLRLSDRLLEIFE